MSFASLARRLGRPVARAMRQRGAPSNGVPVVASRRALMSTDATPAASSTVPPVASTTQKSSGGRRKSRAGKIGLAVVAAAAAGAAGAAYQYQSDEGFRRSVEFWSRGACYRLPCRPRVTNLTKALLALCHVNRVCSLSYLHAVPACATPVQVHLHDRRRGGCGI